MPCLRWSHYNHSPTRRHFLNHTNPFTLSNKSRFTIWQICSLTLTNTFDATKHPGIMCYSWCNDLIIITAGQTSSRKCFTLVFSLSFCIDNILWLWWINCRHWPFIKCSLWEMVQATIFQGKSQINLFQKIICTFTIQSKLSLKFGNLKVLNAKMQHRCTACPTKLIDMST